MIDLGRGTDLNPQGPGNMSGNGWRETTAHPEQQQIQPSSMRIAHNLNPSGPLASCA